MHQASLDQALQLPTGDQRVQALAQLNQELDSSWVYQLAETKDLLEELEADLPQALKQPGLTFMQYDGLQKTASNVRLARYWLYEAAPPTLPEGKRRAQQLYSWLLTGQEQVAILER